MTSWLSCKSSSISTKIRSRCLFHMFSGGTWFSLLSLNMCTVCAWGAQHLFHSKLPTGLIWASCGFTANNWAKHSLRISNFYFLLQIPKFILLLKKGEFLGVANISIHYSHITVIAIQCCFFHSACSKEEKRKGSFSPNLCWEWHFTCVYKIQNNAVYKVITPSERLLLDRKSVV